jgi:hypothetical protein
MEQYSLISLGNRQDVTNFFGRASIHVAQCEDQPLGFRQEIEGIIQNCHRFAG